MTRDIIKDLTAHKGIKVFNLMAEFNRNAGWAGYFFNGVDATAVRQLAKYPETGKYDLHITSWHRNHGALQPSEFLQIITEENKYDAKITGYGDDGKNQALAVTRPPVFRSPVPPHITVSWINNGNPAASGYMQFNDPIPTGMPSVLQNGQMKVVMHNSREMDLGIFRSAIKALEQERMTEIAAKLDPQIKAEIDKHYDTMSWEELKKLIVTGVDFNENLAKLYAQYRADTTDDNMPTLSEAMAARWREDAAADRASDEEHDKETIDD